MKIRTHLCIAAIAFITTAAFAETKVTAEYGEIRDGAWKLPSITEPSKSDLAQNAKITVTAGQLHADGAPVTALNDGIVGNSGGEPSDAVFFANKSAEGGKFLMDLGSVQQIRQINSFSFHQWNDDQGGRTPQVYTLSGSTDNQTWTKIADVDSRPNTTGEKWGNQPQGVQIADTTGKDLGRFRYLLWDVKPTQSPLTNKRQSPGEVWSNTFFREFDVNSAATLAVLQPAKLFTPFANLEEIVLVYKSHFDIGYTHLASEAVHDYRTKTIEGALAVVDKNKNLPPEQQFVWTVPGWPMKKILEDWPGQTSERQQRVKDAFKAGHFAAHALPFTMQTEMMEPEGMVRSLGFASKLARDAGRPLPTGAKMTDVPGHTKLLPTLLKNAGVNFLHLGCNPGSATPRVPLIFWWEGPDGSRLLTMYSADYGGGLFPPDGWKHKTWIAMIMAGDNAPPPYPGLVQSHITKIRARIPGVKVRVGTLGDFGDRMMQEDLSDLPVVRENMPDTWIHGTMCNPDGVILARQTVPNLFAAESLHTLLKNWNIATPNPDQAIADGYENSILFYEHTWGGAMYWIGRYAPAKNYIGQCSNWFYGDKWQADLKTKKFDRLIASWEEHTDYARNACKLVTPVLRDELQTLAKSINITGPRTVVFNPLPWEHDGVPALGYKTFPGNPPHLNPLPKTTGERRPDSLSRSTGEGQGEGKVVSDTLENKYFKITLDPARGAIRSLVDKRAGRELVDANAQHGFGQFLHEKFSADDVASYCKAYVRGGLDWAFIEIGKPNLPPSAEVPYRSLTPGACTVTAQTQGDTTALEMRAAPKADGVNYPVATRVILHGDAPYVDLELTIEKPADPWPEAGWICLPFKVNAPQFRVGCNGFIMDPAKDIITGANRHLYALGTGVAVFDAEGRGAGVCGPDTPLVSLDTPGMWKFSLDFVPKKPVVYFNLFNNQWSTNYRFWNEGKWTYRFRIWSFDRYDAESALITPALEARYPLQVVTADAPAGKLPRTQTGLTLSRKGVLVTAFTPSLLRVWEQAGTSGELVVTGLNAKTATPVNLRGEKTGSPIPIKAGKLTFNLSAFAPASYILE
jgi:alpha-mannosidase